MSSSTESGIRGLNEFACKGCGRPWSYKQVLFPYPRLITLKDGKKVKIAVEEVSECVVCASEVIGKRTSESVGGRRLFIGLLRSMVWIEGWGMYAVVCKDCRKFCPDCWDESTHSFIAKRWRGYVKRRA